MHNTTISTLNGATLLSLGQLVYHVCFDGLLLLADFVELLINHVVDKVFRHLVLLSVIQDRIIQLVLECDVELVLEAVTPFFVLGKVLHRSHEASLQEAFRQVETLKLVHGLDLLFSPSTSVVESLVLLFDAGEFTLYLLFPIVVMILLTLLVLSFEFADLLKLGLLLDFQ